MAEPLSRPSASEVCLGGLTATHAVSSVLDMTLSDDHKQALRQAAENVEVAKEALDRATAERERLIHQAAQAGGSYREIAAEAGLAHQRVHQLLTGDKPPQMPYGMNLLYHCPRCEAEPGKHCVDDKGKERRAIHQERSYRAYNVRLEGTEQPRDDEPGPLTALYQAKEKLNLGFRSEGPIYLNPNDAEAYVRTLREGSYVARWAGRDWEPR